MSEQPGRDRRNAVEAHVRATIHLSGVPLGDAEVESMIVAVGDLLDHAERLAPDDDRPRPNGMTADDMRVSNR